ncbi:hypothetical protein [Cupriavidus sp. D39]|uniref:hypothetical protein n=1 Tax=Cupriavidus sp. D39 TaxID=2997877 RepID=UPI00226F66A5|nr:hypothetical protein [Cupriavidus sp. D39]MCY0857411.1 hypothetical protein [Cupriavidus sp. D39]
MSGPKVVRVVTRDERIARGRDQLAQLDHAMANWSREGQRLGQLDQATLAATRERRAGLQALLEADRFGALQRGAAAELAFLQGDLEACRQRAAEQAGQARQQQRQLIQNAATLRRAHQQRDQQRDPQRALPADLLTALQAIEDGTLHGPQAQAALARGFTLMAPPEERAALSDAQRALASALSAGVPTETLSQWQARQPGATDARLRQIDHHIGMLEALDDHDAAASFAARAANAQAETASARRSMLLDSLLLDLAAAARERQVRAGWLLRLDALAARLDGLGTLGSGTLDQDALALRKVIDIACQAADAATIGVQCEHGEAMLETLLQRQAALARREAVLGGLASLGYEVREGMATAWAEQGKVALRKTATPGYGVELGGAGDSARLQVRAVAFSEVRDTSRDRDIETIWCGEFTRLQALVAQRGAGIEIERALPVGAAPLRVATLENEPAPAAAATTASLQRTLPRA